MYQITPMNPEFDFLPDREDIERFKVRPNIQVSITYLPPDKNIAIVDVIYSLHCDFEDKKKAPKIMAYAKSPYTIIKNDNLDLQYKSQTVFTCVKMLEISFNEFLLSRKSKTTLQTYGIKPITFQSWLTNGAAGIQFSLN